MPSEREPPTPIVVETSESRIRGVPSVDEIERRRRVVSEMRWLRDKVIGPVEGTIAELLSDEDGELGGE